MTTPQMFTDPVVLQQIDRPLLREFLQHFTDDLTAANLILPNPDLSDNDFFSSFAALLNASELLPASMHEALCAIAELAAPENQPRLETAVFNAPLGLGLDLQSPPVRLAFHLWLWRPYQISKDGSHRREEVDPTSRPGDATRIHQPKIAQSDQAGNEGGSAVSRTNDGGLAAPKPSEGGPLAPTAPPRPESDAHAWLTFPEPCSDHGHHLLRDFFERWKKDFQAKYPQLPDSPYPCDDSFFEAVLPLLTSFEDLPDRMREACLAIEKLAAPENRELLRGLLAETGIRGEPLDPPELLALEFFLRRPFALASFDDLRRDLDSRPTPWRHSRADSGNGSETSISDEPSTLNSQPTTTPIPGDLAAISRFPRHKISRLPVEIRESINRMLRDRIPYHEILQKLGEVGKTLNKNNLSRWKKTGYLIWLKECQRREDAAAQIQLHLDLLRENENGKIHLAAQQIGALKICQLLAEFDLALLRKTLEQEPEGFLHLLQMLPKLSQGGMACEEVGLEVAKRKVKLGKAKIPPHKRGLTPETLKLLNEQLHLM